MRYQPSAEALAAIEELEGQLADPATGRWSDDAEETLFAVEQALGEGNNAYWHRAEDMLEALTSGEATARMQPAEARALHQTVEQLLELLHERFETTGHGKESLR